MLVYYDSNSLLGISASDTSVILDLFLEKVKIQLLLNYDGKENTK